MKNKVLHIIKSKSFLSDGRLLKWISTLNINKLNSDVIILEDENIRDSLMYNDTRIEKLSLFTRIFFKQRKGYFIKVPEYFLKSISKIFKSNSDILIFHDVQQYLNIFLILIFPFHKNKVLVWDLHELPHQVLFKYSLTRGILKFILENVDIVVYTNKERREYIYRFLKMEEKKSFVLNNYPDQKYLDEPLSIIPKPLRSLRKDKPYVLWLGGGLQNRNFGVFLEAFKLISNKYNLVILGKIDSIYQNVINNYISSNIAYNAFVKQEEMIKYIDNAKFSVILYNSSTMNNYYCEPNRLYQLLTRGIPTIVGNNPTMRSVINKYQGGIVLEDDGSNLEELILAMTKLDNNSNFMRIKENLKNPAIKKAINWNLQFNDLVIQIKKI